MSPLNHRAYFLNFNCLYHFFVLFLENDLEVRRKGHSLNYTSLVIDLLDFQASLSVFSQGAAYTGWGVSSPQAEMMPWASLLVITESWVQNHSDGGGLTS